MFTKAQWEALGLPAVVFYVGSGMNLSLRSITPVCLTEQYKHHNRKPRMRLPMEEELRQKGGKYWTEILHIQDKEIEQKINTECQSGKDNTLRTIENSLIFSSFCDYLKIYSTYKNRIFKFYNDKIERLNDIFMFL